MEPEKEIVTFFMLIGVPGSGKSTWAAQQAAQGIHVHSSDAIRGELFQDESCQNDPKLIFDELHRRVLQDLHDGISCVYDATNVDRRSRMGFLSSVPKGVRKVCILFLTTPEECFKRDRQRTRQVSRKVIDKFLRRFQCPDRYEGWDEIVPIVSGPSFHLSDRQMNGFSRSDVHNGQTLGEHHRAARQYAVEHRFSRAVQIAAGYHDCGKPAALEVPDPILPPNMDVFFGHEGYSTYLFLLDACQKDKTWKYGGFDRALYIAQLINWHEGSFAGCKHRCFITGAEQRLIGKRMTQDLMALREADRNAN